LLKASAIALLALTGAWAAACGGSSQQAPPANVVNGTVRGHTLSVQSAISAIGDPNTATNLYQYQYPTAILLSDTANACGMLMPNGPIPGTEVLSFRLGRAADGAWSSATAVGTYGIGSAGAGRYAAGEVDLSVSGSHMLVNIVSGTLDISAVDATTGAYQGTFDVMDADGDHLTGSFAATGCGALNSDWTNP
jgi:hypothetical protein